MVSWPEMPKSAVIEDYTPSRLAHGLQVAERRLEGGRPINPRAMAALIMYTETVKEAMTADTQSKRREKVTEVRLFEKTFERKKFLMGDTTAEESQLDQATLSLRAAAYFARYGDYFADTLSRVKHEIFKGTPPGSQHIAGGQLWTAVWADYKNEQAMKEDSPKPVTEAILSSCGRLAINARVTLKTIEHYAERNEMFHKGFDELLRRQEWHTIKQQIWDDLEVLPRLIPLGREDDLEAIRRGSRGV